MKRTGLLPKKRPPVSAMGLYVTRLPMAALSHFHFVRRCQVDPQPQVGQISYLEVLTMAIREVPRWVGHPGVQHGVEP